MRSSEGQGRWRIKCRGLSGTVDVTRVQLSEQSARQETNRVELTVDDGVGFVLNRKQDVGLGLRSIQERVRLVQGITSLDSGLQGDHPRCPGSGAHQSVCSLSPRDSR